MSEPATAATGNSSDRILARLAKTRSWMQERGLDRLFVYSYRSSMTAYWTGYTPRHSVTNASLLVITGSDAVHITRLPLHMATAEGAQAPIPITCAAPNRWAVASVTDLAATAAAWLAEAGPSGTNGFAAYWPEAGVVRALEARFGPVADLSAELAEFLAIKDAAELDSVRAAAKVAQDAFDAGFQALHVGGTAQDAVSAAERVLRECGSSTWYCFAGGTDAAGRTLLQPTRTVLSKGDRAYLEVIPDIESFCPEIASAIYMGEVPPGLTEADNLVEYALGQAIATMNSRMSFADLFAVMMTPLEDAGYSRDTITRLGHGTGIDNIELPEFFAADDERLLGDGRIISIHPNLNSDDFGHLVRGGTVIVRADDCEPLFRLPAGPLVTN
jgi:Xaa-Pro aminopeptidase